MSGLIYNLETLTERAIKLLQMYQPKDRSYYGCFSGGKDSCGIKELARMAKINIIWHYNVTTIDPPEVVRFIKKEHPDVVFEVPEHNFWTESEKNGFPTRINRWCCRVFKESRAPIGEVQVMGVRRQESVARAKRWKEVTAHNKTGTYVIAPIVEWSHSEIWEFIYTHKLSYCQLYDEGFDRLGCVGCPMGGSHSRKKQFQRWPHFERLWKLSFQRIWEKRSGSLDRNGKVWFGDRHFKSAEEMFEWWLNDEASLDKEECQGLLEFYS